MPLEIPERPENWMRCIAFRDKNHNLAATGVVFPDDSVVIHWASGTLSTYPNGTAAQEHLEGYTHGVTEVLVYDQH